MADQNIVKAQKYLNSKYGHRNGWIKLEENGISGTKLCQGLIRAFQIQNSVSVTATLDNPTLNKMRSLAKIVPNDKANPNINIIQCALYAKGYNPGGISGTMNATSMKAVNEFQANAGIAVAKRVNWKAWMGLVSLNWFKKASGGDANIITIQKQLNADWSNIIGVGPCDGVVARHTAFALIAALQAAEGVHTKFMGTINGLTFDKQTTAKFPKVLKQGQNGDFVKYNKLVQYGLYLNGYKGKFDGNYDSALADSVTAFQNFYALGSIVTKGEVNCSTMKSLLTSKGDTARKAKACDCATVLNAKQAKDLKKAGYEVVGRYLTGKIGINNNIPKYLTLEEIKHIQNAGLRVFPIYQDGGKRIEYFENLKQGELDGDKAIKASKKIGVPKGTTIYFAVDFDCSISQMNKYIVPYFQKVKAVFTGSKNTKNYKIGIYGPRLICTTISNKGLAELSFVADMSTGYGGNLGYPIPKNWAFDQFYTLSKQNGDQFPSTPSFDLDKDGYSGRDKGISKFDPKSLESDELAE